MGKKESKKSKKESTSDSDTEVENENATKDRKKQLNTIQDEHKFKKSKKQKFESDAVEEIIEKKSKKSKKSKKKSKKEIDSDPTEEEILLQEQSSEEEEVHKKVKTDPSFNQYNQKPYSKKYFEILEKRQQLPAWNCKKKLLKLVKNNQILILQGETGSGKTTQVPQFLLDAGYGEKCIAITQPRRVAAMSVAQRVADEMDCQLGQEVGYTIRFEDKSSKNTKLKFLTDGMLLREAMFDPLLEKYSTIILDEAHERTLSTDILFGLIKEIIKVRQNLKLIVMSATMNVEKFSKYFLGAPLLDIPGRVFPVEVMYCQQPEEDYLNAAIRTVLQIHSQEKEGDILLFLTGEEEIEYACEEIYRRVNELDDTEVGDIMVVPLYSSLPPQMQQKIFDKAPQKNRHGIPGRKVVVSTNIAETSITIDGIVYVVDPGFSKQKVYNPRMGVESLLVSPISQANAKQRSGRAGRTRPGQCYRLYTEESYEKELIPETYPEILRSNLASVILNLKKLGINDLVHFDFIDPPAPETLMRGLELLNYIEALDDEGQLTKLGQQMAEFPLEPELAKIILSSQDYKCGQEIASITAMLSVPNVFQRPFDRQRAADEYKAKFSHPEGDHLTLLNIFNGFKQNGEQEKWCRQHFFSYRSLKSATDVRKQIINIMEKVSINITSNKYDFPEYFTNIQKCILTGFFTQISFAQKNKTYVTIKDQQVVAIHPSSSLNGKPNWVLYGEFALTKKNYIRNCLRIHGEWLFDVAPDFFDPSAVKNSDAKKELQRIKDKLIKEIQQNPNSLPKSSSADVFNSKLLQWKPHKEFAYFQINRQAGSYV